MTPHLAALLWADAIVLCLVLITLLATKRAWTASIHGTPGPARMRPWYGWSPLADSPARQRQRRLNDLWEWFYRRGFDYYDARAKAQRLIRLEDLGVPDEEPVAKEPQRGVCGEVGDQ